MFDLALTPKGDLVFMENEYRSRPLAVSFGITQSSLVKIAFEVADCTPITLPENGIRVSFKLEELKNNKKAMILFDGDAKKQAIKTRLAAALGELPQRKDVGSKLELVRHKPIHDRLIQATLRGYVIEALKGIIPKVDVRVEPSVDKVNGYSQGTNIYVYDSGLLVYKYNLKE